MKVYVGNLAYTVDENKLKELFASYGELSEVTIIKDRFSGRSKGFGFITFADDEAAKKAITEMSGKEVGGRAMNVSEAKPMEDRPRRSFDNSRRRY